MKIPPGSLIFLGGLMAANLTYFKNLLSGCQKADAAFPNYYIVSENPADWKETKDIFNILKNEFPINYIEPEDAVDKEGLEKLVCGSVFREIFKEAPPERSSVVFLYRLGNDIEAEELMNSGKTFTGTFAKNKRLMNVVDLLGKYESLDEESKKLLNEFVYLGARNCPEINFWILTEKEPINSKFVGIVERFRGEYDIMQISGGSVFRQPYR